MCGIFGLTTNFNISFKDLNYEIKNFVRYSDTRGSDAFGISIKIDDKNYVFKENSIPLDVFKKDEYKKFFNHFLEKKN